MVITVFFMSLNMSIRFILQDRSAWTEMTQVLLTYRKPVALLFYFYGRDGFQSR